MDLASRIRQRGPQIHRYRPDRLAPTVSVRMEFVVGDTAFSDPSTWMAAICSACLKALRDDPLPAGRFARRLRLPGSKGGGLRVGLDGGQRWVQVDQACADLDALASRFRGEQQAEPGLGWRSGSPWLEVLDLSSLKISDWRGVLAAPLIARLVLLALDYAPQKTSPKPRVVHPVVLDFDHRLMDAGRASRFLQAIQDQLPRGGTS